MKKISIIMPIYNDGEGLDKSIGSVIKQTLTDIELICVNDGSTDNSLDILNDYCEKHDFIKVLSQENQGSGKARNYGIREACGEYIGFLDADDFFIDDDALEKLYEVASKNDALMVSGNIKLVDGDGNFSPFTYLDYFTDYSVIQPQDYGIPWSFYKNIFKTTFLRENGIEFPDLLRGQDPVFLAEVLAKVDEIYAVPSDVYAYYYISGANQCNTSKKRYDHMMHYKMVFDYLSDSRFDRIRHLFRYEMLGFITMMGLDGGEDILNATREIFKDDPKVLHDFEEAFYIKHEKDDLKELVDYKEDIDNPRISVIVDKPFESLDDLSNQLFTDFEILSTNPSNDSRIRHIDEIDLSQIKGDYVYLYNPNDNLKRNALKQAYKNAILNESDIVIFNADEEFLKDKLDGINPNRLAFDYEFIKEEIFKIAFALPKLFKKEFLNDNNLKPDDAFEAILKAEYISLTKKVICDVRLEDVDLDEIRNSLIDINRFDEFERQFNSFEIACSLEHISSNEDLKEAQDKFKGLDMENDRAYDLILSCKDIDEFNLKYDIIKLEEDLKDYKNQFRILKRKNRKLKRKQRKLKSKNEELLNSDDGKISNPFGKFKF